MSQPPQPLVYAALLAAAVWIGANRMSVAETPQETTPAASPEHLKTPAERGTDKSVRAHYLITTADDFIVNLYHNGKQVPESKRQILVERFGATVERIDVPVREGDWLVFNVVNNRLRWGGASYFGVAGCFDRNEFGFTSELESGNWSACDTTADVERFISRKNDLRHQAAQAIAQPWHEGTPLMREHAGDAWEGAAVWGTSPNTWIKVIVE